MTEMRRDPRRATPPDASCPGILVAVARSGGRTSVIVTTVAVVSQAVTAPAIATAVPAAPHPRPADDALDRRTADEEGERGHADRDNDPHGAR
ncbi:hypothetical protein [Microbacterium lacticum]